MGRALGAIAPIAAGAMFPNFGTTALGGLFGSGVAAGALTGAGIAALTGDDPLMGALGGGFGGYGGGGLRGAMDATKLAGASPTTPQFAGAISQTPMTNTLASQAGTFNPALTGQVTPAGLPPLTSTRVIPRTPYSGALGPNMAQVNPGATIGSGGYNPSALGRAGDSFSAALDNPGAFVNNLGGGSTAAGVGKLAMTAAPPILSAMEPEYESFEEIEDVYDPNKQLNLNMDTGIKAALEKDTGLRLYAEGGDVGGASGVTGAGLAPGATIASGVTGAMSETISGPGGTETFSSMVASGVHPANAAAMLGMDTAPYLDTGPGMTFYGSGSTPTSSGIGALPPPPAPFTPTTDFDYEEYKGGYMDPLGGKTPVGLGTGGYGPSPVSPGITKTRFEEMIRKGYANGGYLDGPGDGMSDDIPAMIGNKQPAALSEGEFVVPADVVSHLGNGSSDAGSKQLYGMMDKIRKARTGTEKQGKQINPERFMPG